jgi:hypothetical protein
MAPILAPILGVHFWGEHISLKMGPFAPFSATIQARVKASKRGAECYPRGDY